MVWLILFISLVITTISIAVMVVRFNHYHLFPLWQYSLCVLGVMLGPGLVTLCITYLLFR
jgi:hypothetical protein